MSRRRGKRSTGWRLAWMVLLAPALVWVASRAEVALAQLDLSVFQKEGVGEEEQSKDRFDCHTRAVQRTGFDPAVRDPDDLPPMRAKEKDKIKAEQAVEWRKQQLQYGDALKRCMKERGYTIVEH